MKELSELEKDFLSDLLELSKRTHDIFFGNLVDKYLPDIAVSLDRKNKRVEYLFDKEKFYDSNPSILAVEVRELSWTFMKLVKLLNYLEENNYLYLYQETITDKTSRFGQLIRGQECISSTLNDPEITKLLLECSSRTIVIGQPLIKYIENEFTSEEQIRHNENLSIAKNSLEHAEQGVEQSRRSVQAATYAIIVSVVLGIIGIASSFYIANQQAKNATKIDSKQFIELNKQLNSLNKQIKLIDSRIKKFKIPDTLNTRLINIEPINAHITNKIELKEKAGNK